MRARLAALFCVVLLSGCNQGQNGADETRRQLDGMATTLRDLQAQATETQTFARATSDDVKSLVGRLDRIEAELAAGGKQKRGAFSLVLEVDAVCENDDQCVETAKAICRKINYPNAVTSRFNPGPRPTLHALVCFD